MIGDCLDLVQRLKHAYSLGAEKAGLVRNNMFMFGAIEDPRICYGLHEVGGMFEQIRVNDLRLREIETAISYMNPLEKVTSYMGFFL